MAKLSGLGLLVQGQAQQSARLAEFGVQWGRSAVLAAMHGCFSYSNLAIC